MGDSLGLAVWTQDEAGPCHPKPYAGQAWHEPGQPLRLSHEYVRQGTAKLLVLVHPTTGQVRAKGVRQCTNAVLHPWLKAEFTAILATLPPAPQGERSYNRALWERWQEGLQCRITLAQELPVLRLLVVMDNLAGHQTPELVLWMFAHGIMPLYTPLSGSWLNMAESIQRILKRRALEGQHPQTPRRDYGVTGSDSVWLESNTHTVCVGRKTRLAPRPQPPTSVSAWWLWSVCCPPASTTPLARATMATIMSNDPLVLHRKRFEG